MSFVWNIPILSITGIANVTFFLIIGVLTKFTSTDQEFNLVLELPTIISMNSRSVQSRIICEPCPIIFLAWSRIIGLIHPRVLAPSVVFIVALFLLPPIIIVGLSVSDQYGPYLDVSS